MYAAKYLLFLGFMFMKLPQQVQGHSLRQDKTKESKELRKPRLILLFFWEALPFFLQILIELL